MKKQFLLFLLSMCSGVCVTQAQEADWSSLITASPAITVTCNNDATYPWSLEDGALKSTNTDHNSMSTFRLTITCEHLTCVSWKYRLSSESGDKLIVSHDGARLYAEGSLKDWTDYTLWIAPGEHELCFSYSKNASQSQNDDEVGVSSIALRDYESEAVGISLSAPGQLGEEAVAAVGTLPQMTSMRLTGTLNSEDWRAIKNMTNLVYVDLTATTVTEIPAEAFSSSKIRSIKWPAHLRVIGNKAFYDRYLMGDLVLPETLDSIGAQAFYRNLMKSVTLPHRAVALGEEAFRDNDSLRSVAFNACSARMPRTLFYYCRNLRSVSGTESVKEICNDVFNCCYKLSTVGAMAPATVGISAFYLCYQLESIDLSQASSVGAWAFRECNMLKTANMPNVRSMGDYAFYYCKNLASVTVGDQLSTIPAYAFQQCTALKDITLGASVSQIKSIAFSGVNPQKLYINAPNPPSVEGTPFGSASGTLYVPQYATVSYKLHDYWSKFASVDVNPNPVTQLRLNGRLSLTTNARIPDAPDMLMNLGSSFIVNGDNAQPLGTFTAYYSMSNPSSLISRCAHMSSTASEARFWMGASYWYFVCPPFDVKVSSITTQGGNQVAIRYYDGAARATGSTANWKDVPADGTLQAGQGYIFRVSKDDYVCLPATSDTHDQVFRHEAISTPLAEYASDDSNARNWNLVGNPYACYYDIYCMDYTAPITVWDTNNRTYKAYSIADDDYALRPLEAFFVQKPDGVEAITFQPSGRQTSTTIEHPAGVKAQVSQAASRRLVELSVTNGLTTDRTRLVVNPQASEQYDARCDASKMMSTDVTAQIYSLCGDEAYAICEAPFASGQAHVGMWFPADGEYVIDLDRADLHVQLLDRGVPVALPYTFTATQGTCDDRFVLRISTEATAVEGVTSDTPDAPLYDLQGRSVGTIAPQGIYVQRGKKVVVK